MCLRPDRASHLGEVDGVPNADRLVDIDRSIPSETNIGFIYIPGMSDLTIGLAQPLFQLWNVPLHPLQDGGVSEGDTMFVHHH